MQDFDDDSEKPAGLPGWMATFADMMALLMCFFVLLLSYSEMDAQKFKRIAGAMKQAFGVQNEIRVEDVPKGTSPIFDQFSPGKPEPTPIRQIEQSTRDATKKRLDHSGQDLEDDKTLKALSQANKALMDRLQRLLQKELKQGVLELEMLGQQLIFRIHEKGSFSSASAFLQPRFKPVILKITRLLNDIPGAIIVAGHTDSQPVNSELFNNNWDLSAKRAVAVASQMLRVETFDNARVSVAGHASNMPLVDGDSIAARRKNRRVEIVVTQGKATEGDPVKLLD